MLAVVNVDDLGLHPAVARAVCQLAEAGTVTSTTLMANGPHARQSLDMLAEAGVRERIGIGVHLNILRGKPLSPPEALPSLTDPDTGLFLGSFGALFKRYVLGRVNPVEVEREWAAQIQAVRDMGVEPTHLDGEKHTHAWPGLFRIAGRLARKYGLDWVRRPVERGSVLDFSLPGLRTKFLNACGLLHRMEPGIGVPDLVWGIADQKERLTPGGVARYLRRTRRGGRDQRVIEVVCHPGDPRPEDPPLPPEFGALRVGGQWSVEFAALKSPKWLEVVRAAGGSLANYGQIDPETRDLRN